MKLNYIFVLLLAVLCCNPPQKHSLKIRIINCIEIFALTQSEQFMFIDLDNCLNCSSMIRDQIQFFLDNYDGSVITICKSKKKAKLILGESLFHKVLIDTSGVSKKLNLIKNGPVIYKANIEDYDSLIVDFLK